jgi:tagaturonate reductase
MCLVGTRNDNTYKIMDDASVLDFFAANASLSTEEFVQNYLSNQAFFGEDMTKYEGLVDTLVTYINNIQKDGMRNALKNL